jgi:hypothetical protein
MGRWGRFVANADEYTVHAWEEQRPDGTYYEARFFVNGPEASNIAFADLPSAISQAERLHSTPKQRPSGPRMG